MAAGPNYIWHIDGYDKLKPFGLGIHGCICGYSRKIIWLSVYRTNNNPRVIAGYFLEAIQQYGGTARFIRGDFGTENTLVKQFQRWFRRDMEDTCAYIEGASTLNQRIELWWGYLRREHIQYWMDLFKNLQEGDEYSGSLLDKNLVQFCFMALIQQDLAVSMWNNHTIRQTRNANAPGGQPNRLFYYPVLLITRNYIHPVHQQDIDACRQQVEFCSPICCDDEVYETCISIMAESNLFPPNTSQDALYLYRHLRSSID